MQQLDRSIYILQVNLNLIQEQQEQSSRDPNLSLTHNINGGAFCLRRMQPTGAGMRYCE